MNLLFKKIILISLKMVLIITDGVEGTTSGCKKLGDSIGCCSWTTIRCDSIGSC
jgi:hypothetical protein